MSKNIREELKELSNKLQVLCTASDLLEAASFRKWCLESLAVIPQDQWESVLASGKMDEHLKRIGLHRFLEFNEDNLEKVIKHIRSNISPGRTHDQQIDALIEKVRLNGSRTHPSRNMFSDDEIKHAKHMIVEIANCRRGDMETLEACKYILGCNPWDPRGCADE